MKSSIWRKSICSADFVATDSVAESISWSIHGPTIERHQVPNSKQPAPGPRILTSFLCRRPLASKIQGFEAVFEGRRTAKALEYQDLGFDRQAHNPKVVIRLQYELSTPSTLFLQILTPQKTQEKW